MQPVAGSFVPPAAVPLTPPDAFVTPAGPIIPDASVTTDAGTAPLATISVCASGLASHATIGAAIAAAPAGSVIDVCPGTYPERLTIAGKPLYIRATGGAAVTIVDAGATGRGFLIQAVGGTGVTLEGFTIRNGKTVDEGGAIRCESSTLRVLGSVIATSAAQGGGGLYATACVLDVSWSAFNDNDGGERGGGALLVGSSGELRSNKFADNKGINGGGLHSIDGSVVIRSNEFRTNHAVLRGGGLYHDSDGLVDANMIIGNDAGWTGGGIHINLHAPTLRGNTISKNTSTNDGGGIYIHESPSFLLENIITDNVSGDDGGGIRIFTSAARLERNQIDRNMADDGGGGIRISHKACLLVDNLVRENRSTVGGGIDLDNDSSVVRGGVISENRADQGGGINAVLFPWFGGTIENVRIIKNRAYWGGGIALDNNFQQVALRGLTLEGNTGGRGGGLYVRGTKFTLSNSVFIKNISTGKGGALLVGINRPWRDPCPPCPPQTTGKVDFVVMYGNTAPEGSGLWTDATGLSIGNSILSGNGGPNTVVVAPVEKMAPVVPQWHYNNILPATFMGMANPTGTNGNLAVDPLFTSPATGDFQLLPGSPARNAGDPALLDQDGSRADMGQFGGPAMP